MHDVREKQREARRRSFVNGRSFRRINGSLWRGFLNSPGPPLSKTRKHSSAVVAIRMRRSWDGYCRVLISERLSPLHIPSPAPRFDRPVRWDALDDVVDVIRRLDAGVARRLRAACRRRVVIARCCDAVPVRAVMLAR